MCSPHYIMIPLSNPFSRRKGFTLVEIMIVVVIVGLLAAMAIPAFEKARINSQAARIANDFRAFATAFEVQALEEGSWAPDGMGNELPPIVEGYIRGTSWGERAPNGGYWDWELDRLGFVAGVGLSTGPRDNPAVFVRVDEILDDGNLATGTFVRLSDRYVQILEQ